MKSILPSDSIEIESEQLSFILGKNFWDLLYENLKDTFTTKQARSEAEALGILERTLYRIIKSKQLFLKEKHNLYKKIKIEQYKKYLINFLERTNSNETIISTVKIINSYT
jgi:hypothetical protein